MCAACAAVGAALNHVALWKGLITMNRFSVTVGALLLLVGSRPQLAPAQARAQPPLERATPPSPTPGVSRRRPRPADRPGPRRHRRWGRPVFRFGQNYTLTPRDDEVARGGGGFRRRDDRRTRLQRPGRGVRHRPPREHGGRRRRSRDRRWQRGHRPGRSSRERPGRRWRRPSTHRPASAQAASTL